jgi:hypothetical protein
MHLFDTDDPKVLSEQKPFFVTICLFAATTYFFALIGYPVWRCLHPSGSPKSAKQKRGGLMKHFSVGRGSGGEETGENQDVALDKEFEDSDSSRPDSFVVPVRFRRFRVIDTIV